MNHPLYQIDMLDIQKKSSHSFVVNIRLQTYEHAHSPPHFDVTTTLDVSPHAIKMTNVEVDEDSTARAIEAFYQKAVADIAQSFNLNLETYNVYNAGEVTGELRNIVLSIERNVLNLEFQPPYKNVIDSVTFLKGDKGYILFKKSDGTNVVYTVHKPDETWKIKNKASKQGEKMTEEIIWYM